MRPSAWTLIGVLLVAVMLAAVAGLRRAPPPDLTDPRLSTELAGPDGANALKQVLVALGIPVESERRALFTLAADSIAAATTDLVALLDLTERPTDAELHALVRYVERGGAAFLAGWNFDIEECFGYQIVWLRSEGVDSIAVLPPGDVAPIPRTRAVLDLSTLPTPTSRTPRRERCPTLTPSTVDTLLSAEDGRPVTVRLEFAGGGRVLGLADPRYLTNAVLKDTDAAALVVPWLLAERPRRIKVDEYHHGFGGGGSMVGTTWRWTRSHPVGWMLLQASGAALLTILTASVRFGPALDVVDRRRRSAMEHVEALALGLQRAEGRQTAVSLIVRGLRRRLGRQGMSSRPGRSPFELEEWLAALELGARTPEARAKVGELGQLVRAPDSDLSVVQVALAVEDVWKALGHEKTLKRS